jgi:hypothetical protein
MAAAFGDKAITNSVVSLSQSEKSNVSGGAGDCWNYHFSRCADQTVPGEPMNDVDNCDPTEKCFQIFGGWQCGNPQLYFEEAKTIKSLVFGKIDGYCEKDWSGDDPCIYYYKCRCGQAQPEDGKRPCTSVGKIYDRDSSTDQPPLIEPVEDFSDDMLWEMFDNWPYNLCPEFCDDE